MKLSTTDDVRVYLDREKIIPASERASIIHLSGGVSSSVWKILWGKSRWVLKQALGKLNVLADWFSDIERIHREHEVMQALHEILPLGSIPKILYTDYTHHTYIMTCAHDSGQTWKDILMKGHFDQTIASDAASTLRTMHEKSNKISDADKLKFGDQKYFIQLRVEPFHEYLIERYPNLEIYIQQLISEVTQKKICLVHGDFSPKNMLIEKDNHFVLIDFEVAHWGNPVFDLAYCLCHLLLKGWHINKKQESLELIEVFLKTYGNPVDNLIPHLGLMLLARMDGKSPVNYIADEELKIIIRTIAVEWIKHGNKCDSELQCISQAYA